MKNIFRYLIIASVILGINACEESEESSYPFVGDWTNTREVDGKTFKENLTLTENSFDELVKFKLLPMIYIDVLGAKGGLTSTANTLILNVETVGVAEMEETGSFGQMQWYTIESEEFAVIADSIGGAIITCEYEVIDNKLTLKKDLDGDGIYSEEETNIYTRK